MCGCVCGWLCTGCPGVVRSKGRYCGLGDKTAIELSEKGNWLLSPFLRARYASIYNYSYFLLLDGADLRTTAFFSPSFQGVVIMPGKTSKS